MTPGTNRNRGMQAQGLATAFGIATTTAMIRVWSSLPPVYSLEVALLAPYVTMQQADNATYGAISAARPMNGHGGVVGRPVRRPNDLPRPGAAGHCFVTWVGGPLRGALDALADAYASSPGSSKYGVGRALS